MKQENLFTQERFQFREKSVKKVKNKRKDPIVFAKKSNGVIVTVPIDEYGNPYKRWPFFIYMRVDEKFIVIDKRRELGDGTIFESTTLAKAIKFFEKVRK